MGCGNDTWEDAVAAEDTRRDKELHADKELEIEWERDYRRTKKIFDKETRELVRGCYNSRSSGYSKFRKYQTALGRLDDMSTERMESYCTKNGEPDESHRSGGEDHRGRGKEQRRQRELGDNGGGLAK